MGCQPQKAREAVKLDPGSHNRYALVMKLARATVYLVYLVTCAVACSDPLDNDVEPSASPPPPLSLSFGTPQTFDLISWNIESFPKDENETPVYVTRVLQALAPDVVVIQEVWNAQHLARVAQQAGDYDVAIASNDPESGLAFLVNPETVQILTEPRAIYVDQSYDFGYRGPVILRVRYRETDLTLINLHYKCCGDNILTEDWWDEEQRRLQANLLLKDYLDNAAPNAWVIAAGDWNDELQDDPANNIFQPFLDDVDRYRFMDLALAQSDDIRDWSFPWYPSHLDHILINAPLFDAAADPATHVETILVEDALPEGEWDYYNYISDHRPVGVRLPL